MSYRHCGVTFAQGPSKFSDGECDFLCASYMHDGRVLEIRVERPINPDEPDLGELTPDDPRAVELYNAFIAKAKEIGFPTEDFTAEFYGEY